jgi:outer membrane receptor protein involved in Fe transport
MRELTAGTRLIVLGLACVVAATFPSLGATQQSGDAAQSPKNPATAQEMPEVIVIGTAPLPGLGLPLNEVPANVQSADSRDVKRQQTLDLADFMNNNFSGVSISQSQDNPLQADVNYHGFTASPLLGTPQGLSVYVDGVRVNESFGDTVNWDLIPEIAISTITLMPGSNPVFGLNTLGGALSVQTKSGHDNPGSELQAYGGSFGRSAVQGATGGSWGGFDYFVAANDLDETGWRDLSPTHARQAFAKFGWQDEQTDIDLSYTYADNSMIGNGTTPESMLAYRYASIYSAPDYTHNHLNFVNLVGSHFLAEKLLLSGNVYYRDLSTDSQNGDVNDDNYLSDDYSGPDIDCSAALTSHVANAYCSNGINRSARLDQKTAGVGLQLTDSASLFGGKNQLIVGADYSHAEDSYEQRFIYATLTAERNAISNVNPFNPDQVVNSLTGTNEIWGIYLTDTWSPNDLLHFNIAARYNHSNETLNGYSVDTDVGDYPDGFDSANPLTGNHNFNRLNPSVGFTVTPTQSLTLYADYSESSRAPTVIELGCADPNAPCGLPNDFASDPDLKQVVSKTFDVGARGNINGQMFTWSFDLFHTINSNDIQFIATTTSEGYFDNVGNTERQGFDAAVGGKLGELSWHLVYSFVDATYQSSFLVNAESNSSADENGNTLVSPGSRIPLIPRNTGRLMLDYDITRSWDVGASVIVSSGAYLHGNENNANQTGGTNGEGAYVMGSGYIGGYTVVNLFSTLRVAKMLDIFVRVNNLFDHKYATAGFLTSNSFTPGGAFRPDPDDWTNENAVSPSAPIGVWAGIRLHWD